ncbi:unnamed protein product [Lepeophtheirus salmonis]|uniref:(salmon louse) hypothetical protein n=1 Tax=Lepeophtheirus salmonis TaxID=72036 RepID=A0A7R8CL93_LEPSM|nr:uncharacterized protein LOC121129715 [Lepeophtheirus salmonis]CAB4059597.1 unnamed protein product [Lepeophtheirus salmonis]CAF2851051.1 unnamed protein product [Lepeophtheirus salmonis]
MFFKTISYSILFTLSLVYARSTPKGKENNFECRAEGFVRSPESCTEFYRCVDFYGNKIYTPFHFFCPTGTVFDEQLSICNHPWAVPECSSEGAVEIPHSTTVVPTSTVTTSSPEPTTVIDGETFTVVVPSFSFKCTAMGTFPNVNSCSRFWLCKPQDDGGFEPQLFACPLDYNYDTEVRRCLKEEDTNKCEIEESDEVFVRTGIRPIRLRVEQLDRFFKTWNGDV